MPRIVYDGHTYNAAETVTLNDMQQAVYASQGASAPAAWTIELIDGSFVTLHVGAASLVFFGGVEKPQKGSRVAGF